MMEANITVLNTEIWITYQMHEDYIEWALLQTALNTDRDQTTDHNHNCMALLETILRADYTPYIEAKIQESHHWHLEMLATAHPPDNF